MGGWTVGTLRIHHPHPHQSRCEKDNLSHHCHKCDLLVKQWHRRKVGGIQRFDDSIYGLGCSLIGSTCLPVVGSG